MFSPPPLPLNGHLPIGVLRVRPMGATMDLTRREESWK